MNHRFRMYPVPGPRGPMGPPAIPPGGSAHQVLTKFSSGDGDADWEFVDFSVVTGVLDPAQVPLAAVAQYQSDLAIAFTQLTGQIANAQVPLVAVSQYQGDLVIDWSQLTGTPATFPPSAHTHPASQITPGTFGVGGDFIFPENLVVDGALTQNNVLQDVSVNAKDIDLTGAGGFFVSVLDSVDIEGNGQVFLQSNVLDLSLGGRTVYLTAFGTGTDGNFAVTANRNVSVDAAATVSLSAYSGAGVVAIGNGTITLTGTLVAAAATFSGTLTANGNTVLGDSTSDRITGSALVGRDWLPEDASWFLGDITHRWAQVWVSSSLIFKRNAINFTGSTAGLSFQSQTTGVTGWTIYPLNTEVGDVGYDLYIQRSDSGGDFPWLTVIRDTGAWTIVGNGTITGTLEVSSTTKFGGIIYTWPGSQANHRVLHVDGAGALSWAQVDLAADITGIIPSANVSGSYTGITGVGTLTAGTWTATVISEVYGGTNQSSYTLGDLLYASAANTLAKLAGQTTTTKKYLQQVGTGAVSAAPSWQQVDYADLSGTPTLAPIAAQYVTLATDATLTQERVLTPESSVLTLTDAGAGSTVTLGVAANGITDAKLRQSAGLSVIGRSANTTGNVADLTAGTDGFVLRRSGTALGFGLVDLSLSVTGALAGGTVPAAQVTTGTFGAGAYTFPSALTVTDSGLFSGTAAGNDILTAGSNTRASNSYIAVNTAAGFTSGFAVKRAGNYRWVVGGNNTTESGANAGTNFLVSAYDDTGTFIDSPLVITRASGGAITVASGRKLVVGTDPGGSALLRVAADATNGSFRFNGGGTIGAVGFNNDWLLQIYGLPGTSANLHPGTNTTTSGLGVAYTTPSTSTSATTLIATRITTAAAAFTLGTAIGYYLQSPLIGAGSAITTLYGIRVDNQGNASITTSYGLFINTQSGSGTSYAIRTGSGQHLFGDITAIGATSPAAAQMLRIAGTHKDATDAGVIGFLVAVDPVAAVTTGNTQMWVQNRLGSNALTTAIALSIQATSNVAGTGTNVYGIQIANQGLAAITTSYGIQIADQTGSGTNYSLYTGLGTVRLGGPVTVVGQITSTVAGGTSPFVLTSTTVNTNLNADLLDGQHGSYYNDATNLTGIIPSANVSGSYTGITGVGTLTAGTWTATAIDATHGGTAQTTWTLGDLLYASAANTLAKLAGQTTTTKKYLQQVGTGAVSAAPAWAQVDFADLSGIIASAQVSGAYGSITGIGTLVSGAVPASLVTAGTFASGNFVFQGLVTVQGASLAIGTSPASTGVIQLPNNSSIVWRNGANTGNVVGIGINGGNNITIGSSSVVAVSIGNNAQQLTMAGTTGHLTWLNDNISDVGASGATRPRTGYFGTSIVSPVLDSGSSDLTLKRNGTTYLTFSASLISPAFNIDIASGKVYKVNGTQVVGARITGYTAMTGSPDKGTAYDTSTVTLAQLAGRVAQLQADLTTHGLIG